MKIKASLLVFDYTLIEVQRAHCATDPHQQIASAEVYVISYFAALLCNIVPNTLLRLVCLPDNFPC